MVEDTICRVWRIYKISCAESGKSYVGLTVFTADQRWKKHVKSALSPRMALSPIPFARAIRKYGPQAFSVSVLSEHASLREAQAAEIEAIATHITLTPNGYNACLGGAGTKGHFYRFTPEKKARLGVMQYGKVISSEARAKMRAAKLGKPLTKSHRENLSRAFKGIKRPKAILMKLQKAINDHGSRGLQKTPGGKWMARLKINGKTTYLGSYRSKEDASSAYRSAVRDRIATLLPIVSAWVAERTKQASEKAEERRLKTEAVLAEYARAKAKRRFWKEERNRASHSEEANAKRRAAMKRVWQNPEARKRMMTAFLPEVKARRSATLAITLQDQTVRDKLAAAGRKGAEARWAKEKKKP